MNWFVSGIHEELRQEDEGRRPSWQDNLDEGEAYFEFWLGRKMCSLDGCR